MSWPEAHKGTIACIGFDKKFLPVIQRAVDEKMVVWGKNHLFMDLGTAEFDWAGCTWEMTEMRECVTALRLVRGKPTSEDLTAAVLRG